MEKRTITIKGKGYTKTKVDYVIISLTLETFNKDYEKMMVEESQKLIELTDALIKNGLEENEIKTTNFTVEQVYENVRDMNGNYKNEFKGYKCMHLIKIAFDYSIEFLNQILNSITQCNARAMFNIDFTVKNSSKIDEELLKTATINAASKAKILCESSGNQLGQLLSIDYDFKETSYHSNTNYLLKNTQAFSLESSRVNIDIHPEDIEASDSVVFVWEII